MLATGTGLAPYLAILQDETTWQRFERLILVHGAREASTWPTATRSPRCATTPVGRARPQADLPAGGDPRSAGRRAPGAHPELIRDGQPGGRGGPAPRPG
jgi:ferredoxin--NADP+ reductase